jgi:hypothetical protein
VLDAGRELAAGARVTLDSCSLLVLELSRD